MTGAQKVVQALAARKGPTSEWIVGEPCVPPPEALQKALARAAEVDREAEAVVARHIGREGGEHRARVARARARASRSVQQLPADERAGRKAAVRLRDAAAVVARMAPVAQRWGPRRSGLRDFAPARSATRADPSCWSRAG